jgi:hypothetical protein
MDNEQRIGMICFIYNGRHPRGVTAMNNYTFSLKKYHQKKAAFFSSAVVLNAAGTRSSPSSK